MKKPITRRLITFLQSKASGKAVLVLVALTTAIYLVMLLFTIPKVQSFAPEIQLFDLSPGGYSYEHALSLLESLGREGRDVYLFWQLPLDYVYPGCFMVTYSLLLTWLFAKRFEARSKVFWLAIIPVFAGLFDYMENTLIVGMILSYPNVSRVLVHVAATFTVLKSSLSTVTFVSVLGGLVILLIRKHPNVTQR